MTMQAAYFEGQGKWVRDAADWTPESSRRARAFTVYAALRSLGRRGRAAIRFSVSGWRTTEADIDRTVAAFESALVAA